jgi:hypothetical protein
MGILRAYRRPRENYPENWVTVPLYDCSQLDRHFVLNIVIIVIGFDGTHGGHVPSGVTAHGSPSGPLQFGRLEATLAAKFH